MSSPVLADALRPAARVPARIYDLSLIAGFSLLIALSAQVSIPLYPVPVTLQTMMVMLTGALLGSRRGVAAIALYLIEGFAGLPVFSLGRAGVAMLLGPTGGYLVGFLAAAWITGFLVEHKLAGNVLGAVLVSVLGILVPYIPGVAWLGMSGIGFQRAIMLGFLPFMLGDALKVAAALAVLAGANILGTKARQRKEA